VAKEHPQQQEGALSQTEAIRRAIRELGGEAEVPEILDYIWKHFGIGARGRDDLGSGPPVAPAKAAPGARREKDRDAAVSTKASRRRGKKPSTPAVGAGKGSGGRGKSRGQGRSR
jgi:hypothetical protein